MTIEESVTHWISQYHKGDPDAAQAILERYISKLVRLARKKLEREGVSRRVADEEDVALSALNSFCEGVNQGRFPQLKDRNDLWKLLVTITARKAAAQRRYEHRQKRGGGRVRGESAFEELNESDSAAGIDRMFRSEPTPASAAELADEYRRLLDALEDNTAKEIVQWKLEGYTNIEIADKLGCAPRTVDRKLERIRAKWEAMLADELV